VTPTGSGEQVSVVVLTGGGSRRMGRHKPSVRLGGRTLVAWVTDAAHPRPTLVVGLPDDVPDGIPVVLEDPPGGGPVAALGAARDALAPTMSPTAVVIVLAADLPFVTSDHLDRLVESLARMPAADLAVTTDAEGSANWLCGAWRFAALDARLEELRTTPGRAGRAGLDGRSMRELVSGVRTVQVADDAAIAVDVDTPGQLEAARARARREGSDEPT
jgi:molybdopterin-guanine dinucleotide biosynthesis protein A